MRNIFSGEDDYWRFLSAANFYFFDQPLAFAEFERLSPRAREKFLAERKEKARVKILAFALLSNHFHLLINSSQPGGLSRFLADLQNGYARYFNFKYRRSGGLFTGTFKAKEVRRDRIVALTRYLHRHPGLPSDSPWSSYQEWRGERLATLVDSKELQTVLASVGGAENYRKAVEEGNPAAGVEDLLIEPAY